MTTPIATAALSLRPDLSPRPRRPRQALRLAPALAFIVCAGSPCALAANAPALPLTAVTLYRSGVGYFERTGRVGDAPLALGFDLDHLNDVLRSLVVLDPGAKSPPSVSYTSSEPLDRLLARHSIDVRRIVGLADLLSQLRGVQVELTTAEGPLRGPLVAVEARAFENDSGQFATVLTDRGLKSVNLARVASVEILDERVRNDLRDALRTLASRRAEDRAEVSVRFGAGPERDAAVGYIHESPVWKTTYRLVLPENVNEPPLLQGWAIVENQTDEDWDDVRLSLVSGRPVAFTMNLREPLFAARPLVALPIPGTVSSRVYDDAVQKQTTTALAAPRMQRDASATMNQSVIPSTALAEVAPAAPGSGAGSFSGRMGSQSAGAAATSGEQFRYEIAQPVDIPAKSNAMLPILASSVVGKRVSLYNANDLAEHPMRGVEFRNTSDADLAAGPVVVYDGDSYAGDAQVGFTSRGQDRLLTYAVDQDVRALTDHEQTSRTTRVKIVGGVLERSVLWTNTTHYRFINRDGARGRDILVEHARFPGWTLKTPERPDSEFERGQRFRLALKPGDTATLTVSHERVESTSIAVTESNFNDLVALTKDAAASQRFIDAVREAGRLRTEVAAHDAAIARLTTERDEISRDQSRVRSNMSSIDRASDLYARYMRNLTQQEDRLAALTAELEATRSKRDAADAAFRNYLRNLTVE